MEPILTTDRMREADRLTIHELMNGNGALLMEHAGTACVRVLQDMFGENLMDLTVSKNSWNAVSNFFFFPFFFRFRRYAVPVKSFLLA